MKTSRSNNDIQKSDLPNVVQENMPEGTMPFVQSILREVKQLPKGMDREKFDRAVDTIMRQKIDKKTDLYNTIMKDDPLSKEIIRMLFNDFRQNLDKKSIEDDD